MGFEDLSTVDVSLWPEVDVEQRGKRSKVWVTKPDDGTTWLRKSVCERPHRPYENLIEAFVLELARQSGIDSALAFPCTWVAESGQQRGIICREFTTVGREYLMSGAELFSTRAKEGVDLKYALSLELLLGTLPVLAEFGVGVNELLKLLAFDAWVGNGDRHFENWSVIVKHRNKPGPKPFRLAPMYDPAACLGSELGDAQVLNRLSDRIAFENYVARCPSGFGDGHSRILKMSEVVARLVELPEWKSNIEVWLADFRTALASLRTALVEGVQWLPEPRLSLALELLDVRLERLTESTRSE